MIAAAAIVPAFFAWAAIHELSHALCARLWQDAHSFRFRLYPHRKGRRFLWASVTYNIVAVAEEWQLAAKKLAPRLPDVCAAIALPWCAGAPLWVSVLVGGGVVDLAVGSIGRSERSDLWTASWLMGINPWWLRAGGFAVALASVGCWAWGL